MKNIALTLATIVLLAACSSGSTVAPLPATVNSQFSGNFNSQNGNQSGTLRLDVAQTDTAVSGNIIVTNNTNIRCIANGTISNGVNNGFNISFTSAQTRDRFTIVTTITRLRQTGTDAMGNPTTEAEVTTRTEIRDTGVVGTVTTPDGNGGNTTVVTTSTPITGTINFQIAISNNGNTLSGTYTTTGDLCSNGTGTGDFVLNRI